MSGSSRRMGLTLGLCLLQASALRARPQAPPQGPGAPVPPKLAAPDEGRAASAEGRFQALVTREWTWRREQFSGLVDADTACDPRDRRLPSVDAATQAMRLATWTDVLRRLDGIPRGELSDERRDDYDIYRFQIENLAAAVRFRDFEMPLNSDTQFWSDLAFMGDQTFRDAQEAENYLARLGDLPRYFEENVANMRAGLARGFSVPRAVLQGRAASISACAGPGPAEDSTFYRPFLRLPASIPAPRQAELRKACARVLREQVAPAYGRLLAFFQDDYVPHARTTLAAEALPDGKAYYRRLIRENTTLDLEPGAIHALGLREVARIEGEMRATMAATGFKGGFPAFQAFLRTDPRFYARTPEELLMRAAWIAKRVDGKLSHFFGRLPRGRFTIEPAPEALAPFWTGGRGSARTYYVNTYDLPSRPLYTLPALTLHEAAPGHALQGALAEEAKDLAPFRAQGWIPAFGEGWALYCEKLGVEMGIYQTPYEDFGREGYEMWRAARLVIDTGIHHLGWTRDQAMAFLEGHTPLSRHEIETEVDRYISWPAQALSYKLGELKILELRALAERELGPEFDLRAFHDAVLEAGPIPLGLLEAHIRRFITARKERTGNR